MGTSTDAILFYGYCWDDEDILPWGEVSEDDDDANDWEVRYARANGLNKPKEEFPDRGIDRQTGKFDTNYTPSEQAIIDKYNAYWDAKSELADSSKCTVGHHCSGEYPMYYVALAESKITCHRGSMKEVPALLPWPEWGNKLSKFCTAMGIDISKKKLGWWLVSYWG